MLWKLGFLALMTGSIVSVVLSTNIAIVRRLNPDTTRPPFADSFSNRQCSSSSCPSRSTCAGGQCCMCQCLYDWPNVFVNRTSLKCANYGELNRMSSADCRYSFRRPNEPIEVIPLTEKRKGTMRFRSDSTRVDCAESGLSVDKWQFLDVNGRWQNGDGSVFNVDFRTVVGSDGNAEKDLTFLKWNAILHPKYAGLIIKFSLSCGSRNVGCFLAKINGTYTSSGKPETDRTPTSGPTSIHTTGTTQRITPGSTPGIKPGPSSGPTPGPTTVRPSVTGVSETVSRTTMEAPPQSAESQQQAGNGSSSRSKVLWPAVGTTVGLICLICLVCLIVVLYKRRKRRSSEKPAKATEPEIADSDAKLEDAKYPIYAEVPDNTQISDNPLYCLCSPNEEQILRRSKLDPLPALPAHQPSCQPLIAGPN